MNPTRPHPARLWLLTLAVAAWLVASPLLVICTCESGHAVVAPAKHETAACDHEHHHHADPRAPSHDEPAPTHNDSQLSLDIVANPKATMTLPPVVAILDLSWLDTAAAQQTRHHLPVICIDTGPPAAIDGALRATVLLI